MVRIRKGKPYSWSNLIPPKHGIFIPWGTPVFFIPFPPYNCIFWDCPLSAFQIGSVGTKSLKISITSSIDWGKDIDFALGYHNRNVFPHKRRLISNEIIIILFFVNHYMIDHQSFKTISSIFHHSSKNFEVSFFFGLLYSLLLTFIW